MSNLRSIVTGASGGIGGAIADRLRRRGDTVVGLDRDPADGGIVVDLADPEARRSAIDEAIARLGGVDVVVAVAGVYRSANILEAHLDEWRAVWAINLESALDLMQRSARHMVDQSFGRIVTITSVHAQFAQPASLAYDVSKAALEAATRSFALDLAPHGVLANSVAPGFVRTRMSTLPDGRDETDTPEFRAGYLDRGKLPLGRAARADEIAPLVDHLTSRDNTYLTGRTITVDGGLTTTF